MCFANICYDRTSLDIKIHVLNTRVFWPLQPVSLAWSSLANTTCIRCLKLLLIFDPGSFLLVSENTAERPYLPIVTFSVCQNYQYWWSSRATFHCIQSKGTLNCNQWPPDLSGSAFKCPKTCDNPNPHFCQFSAVDCALGLKCVYGLSKIVNLQFMNRNIINTPRRNAPFHKSRHQNDNASYSLVIMAKLCENLLIGAWYKLYFILGTSKFCIWFCWRRCCLRDPNKSPIQFPCGQFNSIACQSRKHHS